MNRPINQVIRISLCLFFLVFSHSIIAQHTFSIVALDPETGEVGSAGATCLNTTSCLGCGGAVIISGLVPGVGAVNAQAQVCLPENDNLLNALDWMSMGLSPDDILAELLANDGCLWGDEDNRQYGIATFDLNGTMNTTSYTGNEALDFAGHIIGDNYAIQGNILIGEEVINNMEEGFLTTEGTLAEKLMGAMQGAKIQGADSRCLEFGTSSLSSFLRVACSDTATNCTDINIVVPEVAEGVEPIDVLQDAFDEALATTASIDAPNNHCATATSLPLDTDLANCTLTEGDFTGANASITPITFCDSQVGTTDLWYNFTTNADLPRNGIFIAAEFDASTNSSDISNVGIAVYESCDASAFYATCMSSDAGNNALLLPSSCIAPETTYWVRIWSRLSNEENTFRICAFEDTNGLSSKEVLWGENVGEGDFSGGLNEWTTTGLLADTDLWEWDEKSRAIGAFTVSVLESRTRCNGAALFNADKLTSGGDADAVSQPYPIHAGELISPIIDLSNALAPAIQFTQLFRGLNGSNNTGVNTQRGALLSYSLDGGQTWNTPTIINDNLDFNEFSPNTDIKTIPMGDAAGASEFRMKFIFDGDFYFWIVDDVMIIDNAVISGADEELLTETTPFKITVHNNLVQNDLILDIELNADTQTKQAILAIYHINGQQTHQAKIDLSAQESFSYAYDMGGLASGMYLVHVELANGVRKVVRVVKN